MWNRYVKRLVWDEEDWNEPQYLVFCYYSGFPKETPESIIHIEYHIVASGNVADFRADYSKYNDY